MNNLDPVTGVAYARETGRRNNPRSRAWIWLAAVSACVVLTGLLAWSDYRTNLRVSRTKQIFAEARHVGSGFFVASDGSMLTAAHAVDGCESIWVYRQHRLHRAKLVAESRNIDAALIQTDKPQAETTVVFAFEPPSEGEQLYAFGFPDVSEQNRSNWRSIKYGRLINDGQWFFAVGIIENGYSGGPIIDLSGRIRGMVKGEIDPEVAGLDQSVPRVRNTIGPSAAALRTLAAKAGLSLATGDLPRRSDWSTVKTAGGSTHLVLCSKYVGDMP